MLATIPRKALSFWDACLYNCLLDREDHGEKKERFLPILWISVI